MIVGDPNRFALESEITKAYEEKSLRALGFFVIHVAGRCFGVREMEATMLANSFDEVGERIARRGQHADPLLAAAAARTLALAVSQAIYGYSERGKPLLGMNDAEIADRFASSQALWAPGGDEAFDDGSYVLHFDLGNRVRLVAFRRTVSSLLDPGSLVETSLEADEFYGILEAWRRGFGEEWKLSPKEDGTIQ
jgi:hypothetical protein